MIIFWFGNLEFIIKIRNMFCLADVSTDPKYIVFACVCFVLLVVVVMVFGWLIWWRTTVISKFKLWLSYLTGQYTSKSIYDFLYNLIKKKTSVNGDTLLFMGLF